MGNETDVCSQHPNDVFMWRDWQEGLKALLPNVNISFGTPPHTSAVPSGLGRGLGQSNGFAVPSQANVTHLPMHSALPSDKSELLPGNFQPCCAAKVTV